MLPTGRVPWPPKLLTRDDEALFRTVAARFQWATVGSDFPANFA